MIFKCPKIKQWFLDGLSNPWMVYKNKRVVTAEQCMAGQFLKQVPTYIRYRDIISSNK